MTDEKRKHVFISAMNAWMANNRPVSGEEEEGRIADYYTTKDIVSEVSSIISFSEEEVAEFLYDCGYEIVNVQHNKNKWEVWTKEEDYE